MTSENLESDRRHHLPRHQTPNDFHYHRLNTPSNKQSPVPQQDLAYAEASLERKTDSLESHTPHNEVNMRISNTDNSYRAAASSPVASNGGVSSTSSVPTNPSFGLASLSSLQSSTRKDTFGGDVTMLSPMGMHRWQLYFRAVFVDCLLSYLLASSWPIGVASLITVFCEE